MMRQNSKASPMLQMLFTSNKNKKTQENQPKNNK